MRRVPTALKEIRGTVRKDRTNAREPRPAAGIPVPRRGLSTSARAWYRRLASLLHSMHVLTVADGPALELLSEALAEYTQARRLLALRGQGYECKTTSGAAMWRTRPEQAVAADSWRRAAHMMEQFGLTPVARAKVEADEPPLPQPLPKPTGTEGKDPRRFFRD